MLHIPERDDRDVVSGPDPVERPSHYTHGGIEVADAIEAWELGWHAGNAVKYIARAGRKDPERTVEDLRKARWMIDRLIKRLSK